MRELTIVVADDHPIVREGLRSLLETEPGISVVGETDDGLEAVELVERVRPDVLIVDMMMPGLNGLEVTRQVNQRVPETRIIVLSVHADDVYVLGALRNGASGYILKESSTAELRVAIHEVVQGRRYLAPPLSERAIEAYVQEADAAAVNIYGDLTSREREVLQLAAEGYGNSEIADRLSISPRTVATHRSNLMRKLDLENQTELVRYAFRKGIISIRD
jgi:two-component system response regulator NreC